MRTASMITVAAMAVLLVSSCDVLLADDWPQFRGVNSAGVSLEKTPLPDELNLGKHTIWKTPLAKGHSSPVIFGDRIYVTSADDGKLVTLALAADTGEVVWQREAEYEKLEKIHRIGSRATPSVATDGELVYSFFGSSGLHAYDLMGNLVWKQPMGPFDDSNGASASPILVDDLVVILQDHDTGSFLAAYDKRTGKQQWRVDRAEFRRNYSTPVVWRQGEEKQIVVAGTAQVNAYDAKTGAHRWVALKGSRVVSSTPVIGEDGRLYVVNSGGGEAPDQPPFAQLLKSSDANKNGKMEPKELPGSIISRFFSQFDRDKDGSMTEEEYESIRQTMLYAGSVAMAIEPGGRGDITETHIAWTYEKSIPRNASPVLIDGRIFMVKDGGIVTVLDAKSGKPLSTKRLRGTGSYHSSPIYGDGKLFVASEPGRLNVITAEPDWQPLATVDFGEDILATPAIAGGRLYVRTVGHLYCLGTP